MEPLSLLISILIFLLMRGPACRICRKPLFWVWFWRCHAQKHTKNNGFSGFSDRYFSETHKKQWFFWFLGDSWEAGRKDKSFSKTRKVIKIWVFIRFLKSNDQKNQKNIVFCMILKRPCSETYIKTMVFLVATFQKPMKKQCVFFLVSGRLLGSRREGQEFLKNQKMFCKVSEK